jgi:hypothetical protein
VIPRAHARIARLHPWAIGVALAYVASLLAFALWPRRLGGEEFRDVMQESDRHSATTWRFYDEAPAEYCFRLSGAYVPMHFCVSRSELEVSPALAEGDYVGAGELALRAGRRPGAAREPF